MTMNVSQGLVFPMVVLPGVGHMSGPGEDEKETVRVFYVAATRATQRLVIKVDGDGVFAKRLGFSKVLQQQYRPPAPQWENEEHKGTKKQ